MAWVERGEMGHIGAPSLAFLQVFATVLDPIYPMKQHSNCLKVQGFQGFVSGPIGLAMSGPK